MHPWLVVCGARFFDLRRLHPAEDFMAMVHPNRCGASAVPEAISGIVIEKWRAAKRP